MPRKPAKAKKPPAATPAAIKRDRRTRQPAYAAAAVLRGQILELRTLGQTIEQIAQKVGRAPSVVHGHLKHALEELDAEHHDKAAKLRSLAYNRLERLLSKAMLKGAAGDLKAMREAQRLIMAQARLMGFDAPIKHASTNPDGNEPAAPGTWTLPMRPTVTIQDWQAQAEVAWQAQQLREKAES